MIIMLVGPIDYWWNENWNTPAHHEYKDWRSDVNQMLVEAGHLVYRPHEAFKGAWNEAAQQVNNWALFISDCLVNVSPPGIPAHGTDEEIAHAKRLNIPVRNAPPRDYTNIADLIVPLADPYGEVQRKHRP